MTLRKRPGSTRLAVTVVMPSVNESRADETVKILKKRAGLEAHYVVALDTQRDGFIATTNRVSDSCTSEYIVYLAEDAFPGSRWLWHAYQKMETENLNLVAFDDGKWEGKIASFGMVRLSWSRRIYGAGVFFQQYRGHRADKELTIIAKAQGSFGYCPQATLVEYDREKPFRVRESDNPNFDQTDRDLFNARVKTGFGGLLSDFQTEAVLAEYPEIRI